MMSLTNCPNCGLKDFDQTACSSGKCDDYLLYFTPNGSPRYLDEEDYYDDDYHDEEEW